MQLIQRLTAYARPTCPGQPKPPLKTLSPERMVDMGQEIFDYSGYLAANLNHEFVYYTSGIRFPPGTKGVFYYYQPPALPPIAGELRLRICDDPSQFASGRDLEADSGKHWNVPLINIVRAANYKQIRRHLLEEGLIDHGLVADIENMNAFNTGGSGIKRAVTLYDFDQPFSISLGRARIRLRLTTRSAVRPITIRPFSLIGEGWTFIPFSGKAICLPSTTNQKLTLGFSGQIKVRFELHTQKEADTEQRMLRLRVLEILTPVTHNTLPDNYNVGTTIVEPVPGDFASRKRKKRLSVESWTFPLARGAEKFINFLAERALEKEKYGV